MMHYDQRPKHQRDHLTLPPTPIQDGGHLDSIVAVSVTFGRRRHRKWTSGTPGDSGSQGKPSPGGAWVDDVESDECLCLFTKNAIFGQGK